MVKSMLIFIRMFFFLLVLQLSPVFALSIIDFYPKTGVAGTVITIKGSGFSSVPENNLVTFHGIKAKVNTATDTMLQVEVPLGASYSNITILANGLIATSIHAFDVTQKTCSVFFHESKYPTGFKTSYVAAGNFNGDENVDLAVTNAANDSVYILLGDGYGTFVIQASYTTGIQPNSIAVGDFNTDGKQDLVIANYGENTVSVLLGIGNGHFTNSVNYFGTYPNSVTVGDFNNDAIQDIATAGEFADRIFIGIGNDSGSFKLGQYYYSENNPVFITNGDVNRDGNQDLVVARGLGMEVFLGDGVGNFAKDIPFSGQYYSSIYATYLCVGDFNGDLIQDVATNHGYPIDKAAIFMGTGDKSLFMIPKYENVGIIPLGITIGDFNGDGIQDLVTANFSDSTISILIGLGDGNFAPQNEIKTGDNPKFIALGDFNNDGMHDLAIANEHGLSVLLSECTFTTEVTNTVLYDFLKLFPNPSSGEVKIESDEIIDEIKISDILGETVYEFLPLNKKTSFQLKKQGLYFVSVTSGQSTIVQKLKID